MTKEEAVEIIKKDMSNIMADENTFRRQFDLYQAEALALQALSNEIWDTKHQKEYIKLSPGSVVYLEPDGIYAIILDFLDSEIPEYMVYTENYIAQKVRITDTVPILQCQSDDMKIHFDKMMSKLCSLRDPMEN